MNEAVFLDFLKSHQPLPPETEMDNLTAATFDDARKYFKAIPNVKSVGLILGAMAKDAGLGVYQIVEDTLVANDRKTVIDELCKGMRSSKPGKRYWSAKISARFEDEALMEPLMELLEDQDLDTRLEALVSLERFGAEVPKAPLVQFLSHETDKHARGIAAEILKL